MAIIGYACGGEDTAERLEGDYEVTDEARAGDCESPLDPVDVEPTERYFHLEHMVLDDGGALLAYYPCAGPGECNDVHDLFRSFGRVDGQWVTTVATAIAPGCLLRFRRRVLEGTGDGVLIVDRAYEQLDDTIDDAACVQALARERGDSMPCVEVTEITARRVP